MGILSGKNKAPSGIIRKRLILSLRIIWWGGIYPLYKYSSLHAGRVSFYSHLRFHTPLSNNPFFVIAPPFFRKLSNAWITWKAEMNTHNNIKTGGNRLRLPNHMKVHRNHFIYANILLLHYKGKTKKMFFKHNYLPLP